jgi:hypothetical protein
MLMAEFMECPYSALMQFAIVGLSIAFAAFFKMHFGHEPIYRQIFVAGLVVYLLCALGTIAFRQRWIRAFRVRYLTYIFWFIYTFSIGFEVSLVFAEFYFK